MTKITCNFIKDFSKCSIIKITTKKKLKLDNNTFHNKTSHSQLQIERYVVCQPSSVVLFHNKDRYFN